VSGHSLLAAWLARAHRIMPRAAGYVHTAIFINTRESGNYPDDLCPLGARRIKLVGVPRVASGYIWGGGEPTILALHGWGSDSTAMSSAVQAAVTCGESTMCFDAPGHGVSPGSQATITEYAQATQVVLQRFPSIHTIVAHSLASIAAVSAVARSDPPTVQSVLLIAPACSLSRVLERWAAQRNLPRGVTTLIYRELERRDSVPVSHWDIRTLGFPTSVQLRIVHDPADDVVPFSDSVLIASAIAAELREAEAGTGHFDIIGSEAMRTALTACLQTPVEHER
jgi:pimeloyl-ACP methyl ester carboxylesterase